MSSLEASLARLLSAPGVDAVALVDAVTGLVYGQAGPGEVDGIECGDFAALVGDILHVAGAQGELESIVVTSTRHHYVLRTVPKRGDPVLLAATLEREQSNLALTLHELGVYATGAMA
ncbi:hypothetical protein OG875_16895 [Streptomyces sp. NBC_01498]|uniref:hypothetical protein n=1 Tax=Streptomyces sp. NBC_01498 TaxID=2975870 RepID=UPI002E7B45AD|nr:hypothetical protein [Streptomyces sp. NBC_01498]WTL26122.1 hypothetical protein OG875_16895 [Streptomyces sp. NBC_01498]